MKSRVPTSRESASGGPRHRQRPAWTAAPWSATATARLAVVGLFVFLILPPVSGCGGSGQPPTTADAAGLDDASRGSSTMADRTASRPGTRPVALEFLHAHQNERGAPYFPLEGLIAVAWSQDGTLLICDEDRGRIFGFASDLQTWYEFDQPNARPYRPVDVLVDGFKVLVLDSGARMLYRFELGGAFQDRVLNFRTVDPAYDTVPVGFDIDLDGRLVVTDGSEEQVLLFDPFLAPTQRLGEPGTHLEQFRNPGGVVFRGDGGFVVADGGNERLQRYNRLGFFEQEVGGRFAIDNPLRAPRGIDVDGHDNLFVADPPAGTVHVFDHRGEFIFSVGPELPLNAVPQAPVDVAVGPDDLLAIADRGRAAVLVFRIIYE